MQTQTFLANSYVINCNIEDLSARIGIISIISLIVLILVTVIITHIVSSAIATLKSNSIITLGSVDNNPTPSSNTSNLYGC